MIAPRMFQVLAPRSIRLSMRSQGTKRAWVERLSNKRSPRSAPRPTQKKAWPWPAVDARDNLDCGNRIAVGTAVASRPPMMHRCRPSAPVLFDIDVDRRSDLTDPDEAQDVTIHDLQGMRSESPTISKARRHDANDFAVAVVGHSPRDPLVLLLALRQPLLRDAVLPIGIDHA
jgi:hypothetical protein